MKIKGIILFITILLFFSNANAQLKTSFTPKEAETITEEIGRCLSSGNISYAIESLGQLPREQQILLFSIIIKTDKFGKVSQVDFTNRSVILDSISFYKNVTGTIKKDKNNIFIKNRSTSFLVPVLIRDDANYTIDATQTFLKSIAELLPLSSSSREQRLIILPTISYNAIIKILCYTGISLQFLG